MIKKIVFSGCSITAGTELWEEQNVPGYPTMTHPQTKKINYTVSEEEIWEYNRKFSYPELIKNQLNIDIKNISVRGISNKEIAMRTILEFPDNYYSDTIAVIQITTHNRILLKYSENSISSAVLQPSHPTHFLNSNQNNILQEFFLEFLNESLTMTEDYMSILYAVQLLKSKNVPCYLLRISPSKLNQPFLEPHLQSNDNIIINEQYPFQLTDIENVLLNEFNKFSLCDKSLEEITKLNYLPQWHFSHRSHELISNYLTEKIKCLHF
jgi:hypothetical protein